MQLHIKSYSRISAITLASLFSLSASAMNVKKVASAGKACPANQPIQASANNGVLLLDLPALTSTTDVGKRLSRSNCAASVTIVNTEQKQYRPTHYVMTLNTSPGNASALSLTLKTWFQGSKKTAMTKLDLLDSGNSGQSNERKIPIEGEWSPCKKDFIVNTDAAMVANSKTGLTKDSGVQFKAGIKVLWESRSCDAVNAGK